MLTYGPFGDLQDTGDFAAAESLYQVTVNLALFRGKSINIGGEKTGYNSGKRGSDSSRSFNWSFRAD
jgi:hypothetical protein